MSEEREPYANAPIIEAVIDFRVELPEGTSVDVFRDLQTRLPGPYLPTQELNEAKFEIRPDSATPVRGAVSDRVGFRFDRADGQRVLQAKLESFSYSFLPPYTEWPVFRDEARALWAVYRDACRPTHIVRVAVRYINRIDIPLKQASAEGMLRLDDYFGTYPHLADGLTHNAMAGFIMQIPVVQPDIESVVLVKQAVVPPPRPGFLSVVLDLDLFRDVRWDPKDEDALWAFMEKLRIRKNEIFEASITDKTRELFN
jgi:uncharacterized protein (TIGR04255 family)